MKLSVCRPNIYHDNGCVQNLKKNCGYIISERNYVGRRTDLDPRDIKKSARYTGAGRIFGKMDVTGEEGDRKVSSYNIKDKSTFLLMAGSHIRTAGSHIRTAGSRIR